MKIAVVCDGAGYTLKKFVCSYLKEKNYDVIDLGCYTPEPCDYPIQANKLCDCINNGLADFGIGICGTGIGMSIACNKHRGIRACCCSEINSARLSREHNNANVLCFGARIINDNIAVELIEAFLHSTFSKEERHVRRVEQLNMLDKN